MTRRMESMQRYILASFPDDHGVLEAVRAAREAELSVVDVYGPFPVHGIEGAMGIRPTRLPWVCLGLGVLGCGIAFWFQFWSSAVSWPLDVGGKPFNSWPAFVPVGFELTVLFASLGTVAAFFLRAKLRPGKRAGIPSKRVTNDRFILVLREGLGGWERNRLTELWQPFGLLDLEERIVEGQR